MLPDLEEIITPDNVLETLAAEFPTRPYGRSNPQQDWANNGWIENLHLDMVLTHALNLGASDIHIETDRVICYTILGDIVPQPMFGTHDEDTMIALVDCMLSYQAAGVFVKELEYDFSYTIRYGTYTGRRFRVNVGKSFGGNMLTFRAISDTIPSLNSLGVDSNLRAMFNNSSGVILVCGATGSGKSTTLASVIRDIQVKEPKKIITIEKPIEYIYPDNGRGLIVQRAIPEDCLSFSNGLTSAMRSAPNIILIGEVRNREEVDELLRASETGHLALSTIHAANNITTLNRVRSLYGGDEQKRVLSTLGDNLKGIVNQVLVKTKDGKKRFAVRETLAVDFEIRKLIQQDQLALIRQKQEENQATLEHGLLREYRKGTISLEEAESKSPDPSYFRYLNK